MTERIIHHPILGKLENRKKISFTFDSQVYQAEEGETLAAALLANGIRTLRYHEESGKTRGFYCNIGHCYECRMNIDGKHGVRACLTLVKDGMVAESRSQLPSPVKNWREDHV